MRLASSVGGGYDPVRAFGPDEPGHRPSAPEPENRLRVGRPTLVDALLAVKRALLKAANSTLPTPAVLFTAGR